MECIVNDVIYYILSLNIPSAALASAGQCGSGASKRQARHSLRSAFAVIIINVT